MLEMSRISWLKYGSIANKALVDSLVNEALNILRQILDDLFPSFPDMMKPVIADIGK